jgi:membrane-associated phospholipid phosphatase
MVIILFFQNLGDWLVSVAKFFTFLGFEEFYLLIMPAMYWCINSLIGTRLAVMLVATSGLNSVLKLVFHSPRPFWVSNEIKAFSSETSFGIPSGHAQNAFALWGTWAGSLRNTWIWLIAGFVILMIGVSRLILGMHFPIDVLLGWTFGGLLLWAFFKLEKPALTWFTSKSVREQVTIILITAAIILFIGNLTIFSLQNYELPTAWIDNGTQAGTTPNPISRDGFTTSAGVFLGFALGLLLIKEHGNFDPGGVFWKRIVRYLLGMVGTLAIWAGLKAFFPSGEEMLPQALRLVRYAALGFWVAAGAPLVFKKLHLIDPRTSESQ